MKRVKKRGTSKNFYLTLFYHISQGLTPAQIARKYGFSKQRINYYIKGLKDMGAIQKKGVGVWEANKGVKITPYRVASQHPPKTFTPIYNIYNEFPKEIRGHAFVFTLKIPNIQNWDKREQFLIKKKIEYAEKLRGVYSIIFKKHKVWLCKDTIVFYVPKSKSYFSNSARGAKDTAIKDFLALVGGLERLFKTSLKINKNYLFNVSRQHYSLIKSELAKYCLDREKKLEVFDKGKLWFLIDNSFNLMESETIDAPRADLDMDGVVSPFMNKLRSNPRILDDLEHTHQEINNRLVRISEDVANTGVVMEQIWNKIKENGKR